ncbi:carboxylesterase 4A-like [Babylonia areolata]|uniref:carboxylesterase 4A-like n=1 Tax=Babylonia areolata TaxID=304850 RepID=UPI003FD20476
MPVVKMVVVHLAPLLLSAACLLSVPECKAQAPPPPPQQRVTIRTPLGDVSGRTSLFLNRLVHQFLGVPYAEPPLAQRRFRKPVPVRPWTNVLDATEFGPSCPQPGWGRGGWYTSEDCLNLNIYVSSRANETLGGPSAPTRGRQPVMVWIHGGGFVAGSGRGVDGVAMAARGRVVVVTLNYRLGMLGWLSTSDDASPGNYGLWDQREALRWVRDNIASFGGDPNQVTIFGESGGGYSVGLHSLSPLNNGLFHRAIMQSGSALSRRAIALDPVTFAQRFGQNLQCLRRTNTGGFDTHFLVECARQRTVNDIIRATEIAAATRSTLAWILDPAPVVDGELIPADIETLLGPGYHQRVPFWAIDVMVGTTNAEGSLVLAPLLPFQGALRINVANGIPTRVLRDNITTALARDYFPGSARGAVSQGLFGEYRSERGDAEQARQVVNLYGDMMFVSAAVETLQRHANRTGGRRSRYQYLFSYSRAGGSPYSWFRGAGHGAEVGFVFGMSAASQQEAHLSLAMLDGWTNFAKSGTPNPPRQQPGAFQWPAYDLVNRSYTNLDLVLTSERDLYSGRMRFWLQTVPSLRNVVTSLTSTSQTSALTQAANGSETSGAESVDSSSSDGAFVAIMGMQSVLKFIVSLLVSLCLV